MLASACMEGGNGDAATGPATMAPGHRGTPESRPPGRDASLAHLLADGCLPTDPSTE